ncbi:MAG: YgfZ/GcvT domain-containing protein [Rehaibacterium terrae]|uniref:CAF17-like 4Fe-4S cluster assembly/insertion protein YgfZ n=1 Tax=Rehaibacterium terrae TaxID=1341696 RepID=UPI00391A601A
MSFNLNPSSTALPAVSGFTLLSIEGIDATAFAQAQFTTDVAALAPGHWHWSAWLTPKGRVVAVFALLKLDPRTLWLLLPDFPAAELAARLQRFVFRSKVALTPCADVAVCADLDGSRLPAPHAPAALLGRPDAGLVLDFSAAGGTRRLVLLPASHPAVGGGDPDADAAWRLADLRHGLPRLAPTQVEAWTPHMLSLDRLAAFSVKKGCYPGQEIVARTHFLGQAKRGLVRLRAAAPLPPDGEVLARDGTALGRIVSVAADGAGCEALAVLPQEAARDALRVGGVAAEPLPLLDGLAR